MYLQTECFEILLFDQPSKQNRFGLLFLFSLPENVVMSINFRSHLGAVQDAWRSHHGAAHAAIRSAHSARSARSASSHPHLVSGGAAVLLALKSSSLQT